MTHKLKIVDLDGTLWQLDARPWVVWKDEPGSPILRLDTYDWLTVERTPLDGEGFVVDHCGRTFAFSEELLKKIQSKGGRKPVSEKMGVSFAEWFMPEELARQVEDIKFYEHVIKDLSKREGDMVVLTSRCNKNKHFGLITTLENRLKIDNLYVKEYHFVGNSNAYCDKEANASKKALTVLQYLMGLQIDRVKNRFLEEETESYLIVDFFDDEPLNLANVENLQSYLNFYFFNSESNVKDKILNRLMSTKLVVYVNRATSNKMKPYDTVKIELQMPEKKFLF